MNEFRPIGFGSDALVDLTGLTRFGRAHSPSPYLIGRHESKEKLDGGPGPCAPITKIGQYAPKAIIMSRPKMKPIGSGSGKLLNTYGYTRFGKANPPRPVLLGRNTPKEKIEPGPGAYDPAKIKDRRIPISMSGKPNSWGAETPQPGPNRYLIPGTMGNGPAFTLSPKYPDMRFDDSSPGPIYDVLPTRKKAFSLTFKPFTPRGKEADPGPLHYGIVPGEQAIKQTRLRFPTVKFGTEFCADCEYETPIVTSLGPGPAAYSRENKSMLLSSPKAIIMSRPKFKLTGCGSGKIQNLFGKTRFGPKGKAGAIIASRHVPKDKAGSSVGPGDYDPQGPKSRRLPVTMKSRHKNCEISSPQPGPAHYRIPSEFGKGKSISFGVKYKCISTLMDRLPKAAGSTKECIENVDQEKKTICSKNAGHGGYMDNFYSKEMKQRKPKTENLEITDCIPYLEKILFC